MQAEDSLLEILPSSFKTFLNEFQIEEKYFTSIKAFKSMPRYIRLKPYKDINLDDLKEDLMTKDIEQLQGIPNFFSLQNEQKIVNSKLYQQGEMYGIDYSSACVIMALNPQKNDKIIDVCCAPGAKLMMIADLMSDKNGVLQGQLFGLDINEKRLSTCKSLINKYQKENIDKIQLVCADGTSYGDYDFFDKVLVDAECTHDGSFKHILKFIEKNEKQVKQQKNEEKLSKNEIKRRQKQNLEKNSNQYQSERDKKNDWDMQDFEERFLDGKKMKNILDLQKKLIKNGFRMLKENGIMIYSTCSFSKLQNEDIVQYLIDSVNTENSQYKAVLIEPYDTQKLQQLKFKEGFTKNTLRFDPQVSKSGGMFLAKLKKIQKQN